MTRETDLDALDDLLLGVRRLLQRPGYRREFFAQLGERMAPGVLRAVRAVDRLGELPCMGDLAAALSVDASTATRLVDQAVTAGYLERRPSPDDQRRTAVVLTAEGKDLLGRANTVRRRLLGDVTAAWPEQDLSTLAELLARLTRDLDRMEEA